jgi:cytidylate kinase
MPIPKVIVIDGPPASGKTTVGSALAARLGYNFLDTGLLYRAITWWLLEQGIDLNDQELIAQSAAMADLNLVPTGDSSWTVLLHGRELGESELRSLEVERAVSYVSAVPAVRERLRDLQRQIAKRSDVIIAGQDIGTIVLPDAPLKVYLDASLEERMRRRGIQASSQTDIEATVAKRSALDASRPVSPLAPAPDAHRIDTNEMSVNEVVDKILALAQRASD